MPHALTDRQREYLEFLGWYIGQNESPPSLTEIADNFGVTLPVAHKTLQALMDKGFLYFERSSVAGFYVRLIERAGAAENVMEVPIAGRVNKYGEVIDFPEHFSNFPAIFSGAKPDEVFALVVMGQIPQANMRTNDFIVFDMKKKPQPGDICIGPIGERFFLIRVASKTYDKDTPSLLMAQDYPIPEALTNPEYGQELHWYPLALNEETEEYLVEATENEWWPYHPLPPDWVAGTALRLIRALHF